VFDMSRTTLGVASSTGKAGSGYRSNGAWSDPEEAGTQHTHYREMDSSSLSLSLSSSSNDRESMGLVDGLQDSSSNNGGLEVLVEKEVGYRTWPRWANYLRYTILIAFLSYRVIVSLSVAFQSLGKRHEDGMNWHVRVTVFNFIIHETAYFLLGIYTLRCERRSHRLSNPRAHFFASLGMMLLTLATACTEVTLPTAAKYYATSYEDGAGAFTSATAMIGASIFWWVVPLFSILAWISPVPKDPGCGCLTILWTHFSLLGYFAFFLAVVCRAYQDSYFDTFGTFFALVEIVAMSILIGIVGVYFAIGGFQDVAYRRKLRAALVHPALPGLLTIPPLMFTSLIAMIEHRASASPLRRFTRAIGVPLGDVPSAFYVIIFVSLGGYYFFLPFVRFLYYRKLWRFILAIRDVWRLSRMRVQLVRDLANIHVQISPLSEIKDTLLDDVADQSVYTGTPGQEEEERRLMVNLVMEFKRTERHLRKEAFDLSEYLM